jgi:VanZ family protein
LSKNNYPLYGLSFKNFLPGIAWFFTLLVLICLPGKDVPDEGWIGIANFDKLVHAVLFGGIVFLFCMPFKKIAIAKQEKINLFARVMIATIVWGFTTELIQKYFIPGRQYDLMDWLADSIGAIAAFFVSLKFFS